VSAAGPRHSGEGYRPIHFGGLAGDSSTFLCKQGKRSLNLEENQQYQTAEGEKIGHFREIPGDVNGVSSDVNGVSGEVNGVSSESPTAGRMGLCLKSRRSRRMTVAHRFIGGDDVGK